MYRCKVVSGVAVLLWQAVEKFGEAVRLSPQTLSFVQLGRVHLLRAEVGKATDVYQTAVKLVIHAFKYSL